MKLSKIVVAACLMGPAAFAKTALDDVTAASKTFHTLLGQTLAPRLSAVESERLHYILDSTLAQTMNATTIEKAMQAISYDSIDQLARNTTRAPKVAVPWAGDVLRKEPMTIVILPGVFAELIKTLAFDDILASPSIFKTEFAALEKRASLAKDPAALDQTFDSKTMKNVNVPLSDLVAAGSVDSRNQPLVKVILFKAPFLSRESVGGLQEQSTVFTRRLEKYLALTGPQKLVFLGYSRGTTTGLEMLSAAAAAKKPWLSMVKGMVSYGGVVMGSTLADAIDDSSTVTSKGIAAAKELINGLQIPTTTPNMSVVQKTNITAQTYAHNAAAYLEFAAKVAKLVPEVARESGTDPNELTDPSSALDPSSIAALTKSMFSGLGLSKWFTDYGTNIERFKRFVAAVIQATEQLRTSERIQWWKTHTVPTEGLRYYSVTAAMADPAVSAFQKALFAPGVAYSGAYDDTSLLKNHRDYTKAAGVDLNDSQVAVAQAMFLPGVIEALNPAQSPMKISNLGVMSVHHWGLALRVVNEMKDHRLNPFPRAAVLTAIAAQVALDQRIEQISGRHTSK